MKPRRLLLFLFLVWNHPGFAGGPLNNNIISLSPDGRPFNNVGENLAVYPEINIPANEQGQKIRHGEYLVKIGDCIACHTVKNGKPFAGGLGFDTPFGVIYSSNITPDKKTGIGKWDLKQFKKAVTEGVSNKHEYLYPAMPFLYYNLITEQDLADIKAYLDAIPAIESKIPDNQMVFPFNWRFLQLGWRILFFEFHKKPSYQFNDHQSAEWNRGAYLVQGLGHCDMCHTPMHYILFKNWVLGAPVYKKHLSGAYVSGFYAPNITELFIKDINVQEFSEVFFKNQLVEGGKVEGPMYQVVHDSLQYLSENDVQAIYSYLSTVKSAIAQKPIAKNRKLQGKIIYEKYCQVCHQQGKGPIQGAPAIHDKWAWASIKKSGIDSMINNAMNGVDGMPIKGTCTDCSEEDIKEAILYMLHESDGL